MLEFLPQNHIDRKTFIDIALKYVDIDTIEFLLATGYHATPSFSLFRYDDDYYIIHRDSGMMISWYKNLGRINTCSQEKRNEKDYIEFFSLLNEETRDM